MRRGLRSGSLAREFWTLKKTPILGGRPSGAASRNKHIVSRAEMDMRGIVMDTWPYIKKGNSGRPNDCCCIPINLEQHQKLGLIIY